MHVKCINSTQKKDRAERARKAPLIVSYVAVDQQPPPKILSMGNNFVNKCYYYSEIIIERYTHDLRQLLPSVSSEARSEIKISCSIDLDKFSLFSLSLPLACNVHLALITFGGY